MLRFWLHTQQQQRGQDLSSPSPLATACALSKSRIPCGVDTSEVAVIVYLSHVRVSRAVGTAGEGTPLCQRVLSCTG